MSTPDDQNCNCLLADQETWEIILDPAFCNDPGAADALAHLLFILKNAIASGPEGSMRVINTLQDGIRMVWPYTKSTGSRGSCTSEGLGNRFVEEVLAVLDELSLNPLLHSRRHPHKNIRWRYPRSFPYRVIYEVIEREKTVVVAAVLHAARHDREWKRRV